MTKTKKYLRSKTKRNHKNKSKTQKGGYRYNSKNSILDSLSSVIDGSSRSRLTSRARSYKHQKSRK